MDVAIIYNSRFGNNKRIAEILSSHFADGGCGVRVVNAAGSKPSELSKADVYVFSAATEAFGIAREMKGYLKGLPNMEGQRFALVCTHGMKRAIALKKMDKLLSKKGMAKVAEMDLQVAKEQDPDGLILPKGYEDEVRAFAERVCGQK